MDSSVYWDMLRWTLTNYRRLMEKVETDIKNKTKRRRWVAKANKELVGLRRKWGE